MNMVYELDNGKKVKIPDEEIEKSMKALDLTKEEAVEMWLEDEGYLDNEEQNELTKKVNESGILHSIHKAGDKTTRKKSDKPKVVKVSDEKKELFGEIWQNVEVFAQDLGGSAKIEKENKLIIVQIGEKTFKIDLIEQRPKKKS
jgi:hypothetical protein